MDKNEQILMWNAIRDLAAAVMAQQYGKDIGKFMIQTPEEHFEIAEKKLDELTQ